MQYSKLIEIYEKLEATSKRLEKTFIISKFLKNIKEEDLEPTILLLQGRVFPEWDERKVGVASRLVLKAINKATGMDVNKIEKEWAKVGDLGKVTEIFVKGKKQATLFSSSLSVKKVLDNLRKLPQLEGQGSVDKKVGLIAELLTSSKPLEARYIIRTLLEELRVGTATGTLRDSIVWAYFPEAKVIYNEEEKKIEVEDRENYNKYISLVQEAYDMSNDFSLVAKMAKKDKIKDIELRVGIPIKVMLGPKEQDAKSALERTGIPAQAEYKYDGFRCVGGTTPLYVKSKGFLCIKDIKKGDCVLTHKGRFKEVTAINKRTIDKDEKLFKVMTFYGNSFKISEKHPILVFKNNSKRWINIENIDKKDKCVFPIPLIKSKLPFDKKLRLGNSAGYSKEIKTNNFFFKFLGYWIGDGFTTNFHNTERVGIIFNNKDKRLADFYEKEIKKNFHIKTISRNLHNGAIYLYWRDKPFRIWLSKNFRREWKGKMLPHWFFGVNKKQFKEFLQGWIESDGHIDKIGRTNIITKERDLAMLGSLIGLKFKKVIGIKRMRVNNKTYYKLVIPKTNKGYNIKNNHYLIDFYSIKEIIKPDSRTLVYNLQVEDDESYCTSTLSLHNCQIHKNNNEITIFTRNLENVTAQFPEVVKCIRSNVKGDSFILDSEAVGFSSKTKEYLPFQSISQRIKRKYSIEKMSEDFPVELNVFDCIFYNGKRMIKEPFEKRRDLIEKIVKQLPKKIVIATGKIVKNESEVNKFYKQSLDLGNEGLMLKKLDAPYKPGARVGYMVKMKEAEEPLDLVIVQAEWGEGKRAKWFSSFTLACLDENNNFVEIGKVGTGIKEKATEDADEVTFEQLTKLLKSLVINQKGKIAKVKPKVVVEIMYEEIQKSPTYSSGYALRFPRVLRLRTADKSPEDATTLNMVREAYNKQKKK
ncbi:hypothetical protein CMO93_03940 [Candidatus Woesearchaeota archaeon]|nr:hypothetical protein [Candidatus Woesearchaeota archaeon]|tara:strand:- start:397 stop:3168 length:2772 start_codon:yes stop_codon:yes gene_type:complete